MELLVFVAALVLLGGLALRFGHDSRRTVSSKEEELAALGMTWGLPARPILYPRRQNRIRAHALRHLAASALFGLAAWLSPELRVSQR